MLTSLPIPIKWQILWQKQVNHVLKIPRKAWVILAAIVSSVRMLLCCNKCHGLIPPEKEAIGCHTPGSRLTWQVCHWDCFLNLTSASSLQLTVNCPYLESYFYVYNLLFLYELMYPIWKKACQVVLIWCTTKGNYIICITCATWWKQQYMTDDSMFLCL